VGSKKPCLAHIGSAVGAALAVLAMSERSMAVNNMVGNCCCCLAKKRCDSRVYEESESRTTGMHSRPASFGMWQHRIILHASSSYAS